MNDRVLLQMDSISKQFPGVVALDQVSMEVHKGEVHALVGENGAGKSTLLKVIFGVLRPDSGHVLFDGEEMDLSEPAQAMRLGITLIPQEVDVFNPLSVAENLCVGREPAGRLPGTMDWKEAREDALSHLTRVGLDVSPQMDAGKLSVAQKQLLLIARALSFDASLLLMDEPTSSLTDHEIEHLFTTIRELRRAGVSVIYVSHKLPEVFALADRVTVLRDGRLIMTAPISETSQPEVVNNMVGRVVATEYPEKHQKPVSQPVLEVKDATRDGVFADISLTVNRGEIVGLFGLVGSGRTEFASSIFGYDSLDSGEVHINGTQVKINSPEEALKAGLGLVPEDRKRYGSFGVRSVRENLSVCVLDRLARFGIVPRKREVDLARRSINKLDVQTPSPEQAMANLSGGNQQKVILGRWLAAEPDILILDEPTRGIDVGSKAEIHTLVAKLAENGKAILYISSELPEILGISDRIIVFHEGRIVGEFDWQMATEQGIMGAIMHTEAGVTTANNVLAESTMPPAG